MHDPRLSYIYMRKDSLRQCMHEAAAQHRTPSISPISLQSKTKLGFNFVEPLWYGRSWPRSQSERGKSNLEWKKNTFILSNYNELVDILSSGMEMPWFFEMYEHVHTFRNIYKHVCTLYVHVHKYSGINMYVHRSDMYVHVCRSINEFRSS